MRRIVPALALLLLVHAPAPGGAQAAGAGGAPADSGPNADLARYASWLRSVESGRGALARDPALAGLLQAAPGTPAMARAQQRLLGATRAWQTQAQRGKPAVPPDLRGADGFIVTALREETSQASTLIQILPNQSRDRVRKLARDGMNVVDRNLAGAQQELDRVARSRQAPPALRLRPSSDGLLGQLAR